jgi:hypothetical protein
MKVWVLCKTDINDRSDVIGVFATLEVAKTIAEAEEPNRKFNWNETLGLWCTSTMFLDGPSYLYDIEEYEVREK